MVDIMKSFEEKRLKMECEHDKKFRRMIITMVVAGPMVASSFLYLVNYFSNKISETGLKSMVNEIWEGSGEKKEDH